MRLTLDIPQFSFAHFIVRTFLRPYLRSTITGGKFMYVVKTDNPDVNYSITAPAATDSEGNAIPEAKLDYEVLSDAPDVVSITPSADDPKAGVVHFGNPGNANINVNISTGGKLLGAFGAQFTATVGDPATIAGGSIVFDGLTEAVTEPTPDASGGPAGVRGARRPR